MADIIKITPDDKHVLVSVKELAYLLGKSHKTVYRWSHEGMPFFAGRIRIGDAEAWLLRKRMSNCKRMSNNG